MVTFDENEREYALFKKEREYFEDRLGEEEWIKVYGNYDDGENDSSWWYCGLIENSHAREALENLSWDLRAGNGFPGCVIRNIGDNEIVEYDRLGFANAEPLVFIRDYLGFRKRHPEISEEFRFFHNLYFSSARNILIKFGDSGEENQIVRISEENEVYIHLKEIRQYLAIKEMHLVVYFQCLRYSEIDMSEINRDESVVKYKDDRLSYEFHIMENHSSDSEPKTVSSISGKKLILPYEKSQSGFWPYNENSRAQNYEEFIIGNKDGEDVKFTCDPSKLANYFGANPESPNYLTPVHFKREVLQRYYMKPERFSVEDSLMRCKGSWELQIDNHHEDIIIVYLGDLGRDLPASERKYWIPFNIPPKGKISQTKYMRDFLATPCPPEAKDILVKESYLRLNTKWYNIFEWGLFRPLQKEDQHFFDSLRVLTINNQSEFDVQILSLAKVVIDALDKKHLASDVLNKPDGDCGSITLFSIFLNEHKFVGIDEGISLLKLIQNIRSAGVAHLKGKTYQRLVRKYKLNESDHRFIFSNMLSNLNVFFEHLMEEMDLIPGR